LSTSKWFFNSAIPFSGTSRPCKRATTVLHPQRQSKRERACACLSGWGGPFCGSLKLNPAAALIVASQIFFHPTNGGGWYVENSWGISVPDDGGALWHGFVTELEQTKRARAVQRRLHRPGFAVLSP
jgi:hypothetical protein